MIGALVSFAMGLAVGVVYGLVRVHSPAPPLIALIGLLGMVLGEQMATAAWRHVTPPPPHSSAQAAEPIAPTDAGEIR